MHANYFHIDRQYSWAMVLVITKQTNKLVVSTLHAQINAHNPLHTHTQKGIHAIMIRTKHFSMFGGVYIIIE